MEGVAINVGTVELFMALNKLAKASRYGIRPLKLNRKPQNGIIFNPDVPDNKLSNGCRKAYHAIKFCHYENGCTDIGYYGEPGDEFDVIVYEYTSCDEPHYSCEVNIHLNTKSYDKSEDNSCCHIIVEKGWWRLAAE